MLLKFETKRKVYSDKAIDKQLEPKEVIEPIYINASNVAMVAPWLVGDTVSKDEVCITFIGDNENFGTVIGTVEEVAERINRSLEYTMLKTPLRVR